ncbi:response regulator transcription factor [Candidatus Chloroploca sp. M-50]|uniref:Response regulator transcription factor n=1 Tax=Candidatus Chloroploca mongolica TaxID=2528176 RepID=A0ABS4DFN8_9CHLR|nr:response regulator transcription factor [Candidatus Chloroploca mongolica]MBP1468179.1 response regulator transcription factor [Candidatus Chloroploca mongolica]
MLNPIRVLIIDDHPLFRQGIRWSLSDADDIEVVGEAENGQEALKLTELLHPDVVLVDINLPGLNGLEVARVIKRRAPRMGIIVLSVYEDDDQLFQAIKVGASAYSSKDVHPEKLRLYIREVALGKYLINDVVLARPVVASRVLHQFRELASSEDEQTSELFAPLTSREIEILDCIARGLSNKEIASELNISSQTVKNHITSILSKLQVNDRTMAVIYAIKRGWIKMGYNAEDEPAPAE